MVVVVVVVVVAVDVVVVGLVDVVVVDAVVVVGSGSLVAVSSEESSSPPHATSIAATITAPMASLSAFMTETIAMGVGGPHVLACTTAGIWWPDDGESGAGDVETRFDTPKGGELMPAEARELVVVVGASGAFGTAIVDRVVGAGYDVLAVGRDADSIQPLVDRHGAAVLPCSADIGADASMAAIRSAVGDRVVRAVVHGAGSTIAGGILDAPTEAIVESVNLKVAGLLRLVRAVDDRLTSGSRIVAIAGHFGLEPTHYAASAGIANAPLFNAVRQLSLAYGERGITAHTIAPGPSDTPRLRRVAADRAAMEGTTVDEVLDSMRADSSIRELTSPEQVAWAVEMLLAPEASAMTGSTLMLDSGIRKGLP